MKLTFRSKPFFHPDSYLVVLLFERKGKKQLFQINIIITGLTRPSFVISEVFQVQISYCEDECKASSVGTDTLVLSAAALEINNRKE